MKLQNVLPDLIIGGFFALCIAAIVLLYFYCRWLFYIIIFLLVLWILFGLLMSTCCDIVYNKQPDYPPDFEDEEFGRDYLIQYKNYSSKRMRLIQRIAEKIINLVNKIL